MRIWTVHPRYLDSRGLVALWRETLLAQKVLQGDTKGYRNHPQLIRFRALQDPLAGIGSYLDAVAGEAERRGYRFDRSRIGPDRLDSSMPETDGQLADEWQHLLHKLAVRAPELHARYHDLPTIEPHPLFIIVPGPVREWEVRFHRSG